MGQTRTDETETGPRQIRPFKDGVEDVLSFAVQLVHLIQNQEPEGTKINDQTQDFYPTERKTKRKKESCKILGPG